MLRYFSYGGHPHAMATHTLTHRRGMSHLSRVCDPPYSAHGHIKISKIRTTKQASEVLAAEEDNKHIKRNNILKETT